MIYTWSLQPNTDRLWQNTDNFDAMHGDQLVMPTMLGEISGACSDGRLTREECC